MLTSGLDFSRYSPRIYIVSEGDTLSASKAVSLERSKASCSLPITVSSRHIRSNSCQHPHVLFRDLVTGGTTEFW